VSIYREELKHFSSGQRKGREFPQNKRYRLNIGHCNGFLKKLQEAY
jgi:hypothetical protein